MPMRRITSKDIIYKLKRQWAAHTCIKRIISQACGSALCTALRRTLLHLRMSKPAETLPCCPAPPAGY